MAGAAVCCPLQENRDRTRCQSSTSMARVFHPVSLVCTSKCAPPLRPARTPRRYPSESLFPSLDLSCPSQLKALPRPRRGCSRGKECFLLCLHWPERNAQVLLRQK